MLSIDTIARVVVNASRNVSVPSSFDTDLLLIHETRDRDLCRRDLRRGRGHGLCHGAAAGERFVFLCAVL